ncbi:flavin reductase, partial [Burkholderia gladioli]|uniref:flavin reductase n=1 Tax=Burkholderia gladioli TaxID=28095 RepID=UPI00285BE24A
MTDPTRAAADEDARQMIRHAIPHLGAAVNLITTAGPHGRCGVTASAVCSVTDAPPTLLICLNRSSSTPATLTGNRSLCVYVLPGE